jgi:hypothetical protein
MQTDFEAGFHFAQEVHGQRRLASFPVSAIVRYFHSLWLCGLKDRLLSVPHTIERYDGQRALELLATWQEGDAASVVEFLQDKLNMLPFGSITRELQEAQRPGGDPVRAQRLAHGRQVLLNRSFNLHTALDTIFSLSPDELTQVVRSSCRDAGLGVEAIRERLAELDAPIYGPAGHPALAQRNMVVMNALGVRVTDHGADRPGYRTARVARPTMPSGPYAETAIRRELEMVPPAYGTAVFMPAEAWNATVVNGFTFEQERAREVER